ncbi:biotin/lipoyl-containing protein [Aquibium sp. LZ166]|uniref:Biotin carboxyl carrier protein of acetyl-CoA carboxylase n=1 Tax=Aquibium pacificus TaxID=3153579 RepID=A0ABV3SLA5_9HYPH
MSLTPDDVKRILELVQNSAFDELRLEAGDLKLVVSKHGRIVDAGGAATAEARLAPTAAPPASAPASPVPAVAPAQAAPAAAAAAPKSPAGSSSDESNLIPIKSPIVGIFYISPEPEAPPYVETGAEIDEDSTVGLVEVMKVFNAVRSGVRGTVVRRLVGNSEFVEFGQPLFLVRPAER